MSKKMALDASALIALIYQEKGHQIVTDALEQSVISAVNLSEVIAYMVKKQVVTKQIMDALVDLAIPVVNFDAEQCFIAGQLIKQTSPFGLSFGDRACLALALHKKHHIITADKAWNKLDLPIEIIQIR